MSLTFESFAKGYDRWITKQDVSVLADIELFVMSDLAERAVDMTQVLQLVCASMPNTSEGRLVDLLTGFNKYCGKVCAVGPDGLYFIGGGGGGASPGGGGGGGNKEVLEAMQAMAMSNEKALKEMRELHSKQMEALTNELTRVCLEAQKDRVPPLSKANVELFKGQEYLSKWMQESCEIFLRRLEVLEKGATGAEDVARELNMVTPEGIPVGTPQKLEDGKVPAWKLSGEYGAMVEWWELMFKSYTEYVRSYKQGTYRGGSSKVSSSPSKQGGEGGVVRFIGNGRAAISSFGRRMVIGWMSMGSRPTHVMFVYAMASERSFTTVSSARTKRGAWKR